jgi:hypothetical protein
MIGPYRTPAKPRDDAEAFDESRPRDDRVLAALFLVIGGVRVTIALVGAEVFGAEATIALVMVAWAIVMFVRRS